MPSLSGVLGTVGDLLGGPEQGVLQTIQGVKTGNVGDVLRGAGILVGTGAGALLGGPLGAAAGGRLAEVATDRTDGGERLDAVQTLGLPQASGIGGFAEHLGVNMALDPMMYLTGGTSELAQAGDEGAQAAGDAAEASSNALRLRVPILSNRLEAAGIPASLSAPQGLVDAGGALRDSALSAIPMGDGMSLADKLSNLKDTINTAINPQAYRAAQLASHDVDPTLAAPGGVYDSAAAVGRGATNTMLQNFDTQAAAIQKTGGDMQPFLQDAASKAGLSLDGADGLSLDDVRKGVVTAAHDAGTQAFGDYLEANGIPRQVIQQSAGNMPGVYDINAAENVPASVSHPDLSPGLQDIIDARRAGGGFNGSGTAGAPDNFDRVNSLTGQDLTQANPTHTALADLFANRPSLATGTPNQLFRQFNLAMPLSQVKYALGDIARNAMDSGISGIGDVGKAAQIQWALHSIPDEAIATKGLEAAAQEALTPEQFQTWQAARQQNVLGSGYQADTSASGRLGRLAAPLRAEGDNARLANFMDRMGQGASPEEAAAGARATQYDLSDTTPTLAAVRRYAMPGANFTAHNLTAMLGAAVENPALAAGTVQAEQAASDPNAPSWVKTALTSTHLETPLQSALLGNNPVTGTLQTVGGDVKGGMATLGGLPSGPTPVGLLTDLYKESQHRGTGANAIDNLLRDVVPGVRQMQPVAQAVEPDFAGGQQDPVAGLQALLGAAPSSTASSNSPKTSFEAALTRAGITLPTLPTARSIVKAPKR